jgi:hypothetical protein
LVARKSRKLLRLRLLRLKLLRLLKPALLVLPAPLALPVLLVPPVLLAPLALLLHLKLLRSNQDNRLFIKKGSRNGPFFYLFFLSEKHAAHLSSPCLYHHRFLDNFRFTC